MGKDDGMNDIDLEKCREEIKKLRLEVVDLKNQRNMFRNQKLLKAREPSDDWQKKHEIAEETIRHLTKELRGHKIDLDDAARTLQKLHVSDGKEEVMRLKAIIQEMEITHGDDMRSMKHKLNQAKRMSTNKSSSTQLKRENEALLEVISSKILQMKIQQ